MNKPPRPAFNPGAKPRNSKIGNPPGFQQRGEKGTPLVFQLRMIDALEKACFERGEITVTGFRVGLYLVRKSRPVDGYANPEQQEIANALKCHRSHINRALAELERADWLRRDTIHRPTRYFPNWLSVLFPDEHERLFGNAPSNVVPLVAPARPEPNQGV